MARTQKNRRTDSVRTASPKQGRARIHSLPIDAIRVGKRFRRDLGDGLAARLVEIEAPPPPEAPPAASRIGGAK